ncbi:hypothetical protein [Methylobacter tundripaludum]|jgi:predicted RNase H-like nuclease|uniref:hypothetical protein n=1 Tax=Methylobacter tundripaludum TaxID=173365 RepID=UPI00047F9C09|nr:hypothetical protein [Methylobacter tundripaludum]
MKTKLLTLLLAVGLLSACAEMNPHPMDMNLAVQTAKTKADHEALAEHYEEAAKDMQLKVEEHKKLLSQYQSKGFRQSKILKDHCQRLINAYEKAVQENLSMATLHRQM